MVSPELFFPSAWLCGFWTYAYTCVLTKHTHARTHVRWLKRDGGGNEIENFLKNAPFENYPLFLGAEKLKGGIRLFRQTSRRKVDSNVED